MCRMPPCLASSACAIVAATTAKTMVAMSFAIIKFLPKLLLALSLPASDRVDRHANRCVFFDQQEGGACDSLPLVLLALTMVLGDGQKVHRRLGNEKTLL